MSYFLTKGFQKFRAHVVEGDRAVDVMALILCYCLELKDKPSEIHLVASSAQLKEYFRIERNLPCLELHDPITVRRAQFRHPNLAHAYPHTSAG
jgi:hypothetical protein